MISYIAYQASEVMGFMSFMAMLVALWRLHRLPQEVHSIGPASPYDLSIRRMFLWGFAIYMFGTAMREAVVLSASPDHWSDTMIMLSATSRMIQVTGACVYVRGATLPRCREYGWSIILGMALLFSMASPL